jgi:hypothetical protein
MARYHAQSMRWATLLVSARVSAHTIYAPLLPLSGSASVRDREKVNDARHLSPPPTNRAYSLSRRCRCSAAAQVADSACFFSVKYAKI